MPKDPFKNDDEGSQGSLVDQFHKTVREAQGGGRDDDDGDETEEQEVRTEVNEETGKEEVVVTRAQKKQQRGVMREENERLRREKDELNTRLARLEGAFAARQNVRDNTDETDDETEFEAAYEKLQDEHNAAYQAMIAKQKAGTLTEADKTAYKKTSAKIERQRIEMAAERLVERRMAGNVQETAVEVTRAAIRNQYSDVYSNPRAVQYAEGEYRKAIALGKKDGRETLDEAMNSARRAFRMAREPAPSESQRSRFSGAPRGRSGGEREPQTVRMTPELRSMANAKYSHLKNEDDRYKAWANNEGKRMLNDKD